MPANVKRSVLRPLAEHTFPSKLWRLVNNPRNTDVIKWTDDGQGIEIMDNGKFINFLLQDRKNKIFKTKNFASFVRQLNLYGFRKVPTRNKSGLQNNPDRSVFVHKYFKKGRKELLSHVVRRAVSKVRDAPLCSTASSPNSNNLKLGINFPANGGFSSPYSYVSAGPELSAGFPLTLGGTPYPNPCFIGMGQVPSYGPAYGMAMNKQRSTNIDVTGSGTESETCVSRNHSEFGGNTGEDGTESSISQKQNALENTQPILVNSPGDSKLGNESIDKITVNDTSIMVSNQMKDGSANEERVYNTQNEFAPSLVNTVVPSPMVGLSAINDNLLYSNPLTSFSPSVNLINWYNFPSYGPMYDYSSIPTPYSAECGMLPTYNPGMPTTPTDCSPLPSSAIDLQQNSPWFRTLGSQSTRPPQNCASDVGPNGHSTWMTMDYPSSQGDTIPGCFTPQLPIDATCHGYKNTDTFQFQTTTTEPAASDSALKVLSESEFKLSQLTDVTNADQRRSNEDGLVSI